MSVETIQNAEAQAASELEGEETQVEMADKDAGLVEVGNEEQEAAPQEDSVRDAIYKKHSERRQNALGIEPAENEAKPEVKPVERDDEITVKVNGKERLVSKAKIEAAGGVEIFQKNAAASELLNQASAKERQLRDFEAQLNARAQQVEHQAQEIARTAIQKQSVTLPDEGAIKELATKYHEAFMDGDMDTANDLLIKIRAAQPATAVDRDDIASYAVQKAKSELVAEASRAQAEKFEAERLEASNQFHEQHKDIASDPELLGVVNAKTLEIYREHPDWGPKAIMDEAVTRFKKMVSRLNTPSSTAEKQEAKRSMTTVKGGSARTAVKPAVAPQTKSEYVRQMRVARGLE